MPIIALAEAERLALGTMVMLILPLLCFWISASALVSKDTVTGEPFSSRLVTPALTRLFRELRVRFAVREVAPLGMVTFSATVVPFAVLPCAFASACALAMASVTDFSGIDALAELFWPAVAVTGAAAVAGWFGVFPGVVVAGVVVLLELPPEEEPPPPPLYLVKVTLRMVLSAMLDFTAIAFTVVVAVRLIAPV